MTTSRWPRILLGAALSTLSAVAVLTSAGNATAGPSQAPGPSASSGLSWRLLAVPIASHFRGLSAVSASVAWLGGYNGVVLRTVDGGATWRDVSPHAAGALQFRDVQGFDATHAVAMAAGPGGASRIYVTADGGASWQISFRNANPSAFFDCMSFSDRSHGLVLSDPVDGKFRVLATSDGGRSWTFTPATGMPAALPGEAGFAASGECLTTLGPDAWFGTGGGSVARVFHSGDGGRTWDARTWTAQGTPLAAGVGSAGVFGLAFRSPQLGIAVGGDYAAPEKSAKVAARTTDGRSWSLAAAQPSGYRSGVSWVPNSASTALAVGLTGTDVSYDGGRHWTTFDTGQFDTVDCAPDGSCWAAGDLGRVARLQR